VQDEKRPVTITLGGTPEPDGSIIFTFGDGQQRTGLFERTDRCFDAAKAILGPWFAQPHKQLVGSTGNAVMPTMEVDEADALRGEANFKRRVQAMRSKS